MKFKPKRLLLLARNSFAALLNQLGNQRRPAGLKRVSEVVVRME